VGDKNMLQNIFYRCEFVGSPHNCQNSSRYWCRINSI